MTVRGAWEFPHQNLSRNENRAIRDGFSCKLVHISPTGSQIKRLREREMWIAGSAVHHWYWLIWNKKLWGTYVMYLRLNLNSRRTFKASIVRSQWSLISGSFCRHKFKCSSRETSCRNAKNPRRTDWYQKMKSNKLIIELRLHVIY